MSVNTPAAFTVAWWWNTQQPHFPSGNLPWAESIGVPDSTGTARERFNYALTP